jgi:hypothetical protein
MVSVMAVLVMMVMPMIMAATGSPRLEAKSTGSEQASEMKELGSTKDNNDSMCTHGTKAGGVPLGQSCHVLHSPARLLNHGSSCPLVVPVCVVVCVCACVRLLSAGLCACVFETVCMTLAVRVRGQMIYLGVSVKHALCMHVFL